MKFNYFTKEKFNFTISTNFLFILQLDVPGCKERTESHFMQYKSAKKCTCSAWSGIHRNNFCELFANGDGDGYVIYVVLIYSH